MKTKKKRRNRKDCKFYPTEKRIDGLTCTAYGEIYPITCEKICSNYEKRK